MRTKADDQSYGPSLSDDASFGDYVVRKYGVIDGLPSSWIYDVLQTSDGYVWIATQNGLVRYDGLRFKSFDRSNTLQMPANDTRVLFECTNGYLWVGTTGGLVRYKAGRPGAMERIEEFDGNGVHAILEDDRGIIWIGTTRGIWSAKEGCDFEFEDKAPGEVHAFCEDPNGTFWVGSGQGLYRKQGEVYERIAHPRLPKPDLSDNGVPSAGVNVLFAEEGGIWIGANRGLLFFKDGRFENKGAEIGRQRIVDILQTRNGGLYVATRHGLHRSFDGGKFERMATEESTSCIAEDFEGGLWIGHTNHLGLRHYRNGKTRIVLADHNVNCVQEDRDGAMWFGSNSGLHRLRNGVVADFGHAEGLPDMRVQTIARGEGNTFWIGTGSGFAKLSNGELTKVDSPSEISRMNISVAYEDRAGVLWFALKNGRGYTLHDEKLFELDRLKHGRTKWFYEDPRGVLWIGHELGLYQRINNQIQQVSDSAFDRLGTTHFVCHCVESNGTLWLGTSAGIVRYQQGGFDVFTAENGLAHEYIDRMATDTHGNLWLAGRDGAFYISKSEFEEVVAGKRRRVVSHRLSQIDGVGVVSHYPQGCLDSNGTMWLVASDGVIEVSPEPLPKNLIPPKLQIEEVLIDGEIVNADQPVEFHSGRHRLAVSFAALTFTNSRDARVKYKLEGHDGDWIDVGMGRERVAHYTDLGPGIYQFHIAAANSDGVWTDASESIGLTVLPRWFETVWFLVASVFVLVALVAVSTSLFTRNIRRRNEALQNEIYERKVAEEQSRQHLHQLARISRAASMGELSTSIAHEVNQPLFAIVANAEMAQEFLASEQPDIGEVRGALTDIIGDGNRAASIIKHIRSLVRKEQTETESVVLNQVALDALDFVRPEIRDRGLTIRCELVDGSPPVNGNAIELQQVILNLIINGAQATRDADDDSRELLVTTSSQNGFVELSVKDQGVGLDMDSTEKLFDPFFTTKPQGTGMGLAINRTIIEAHGGSIWATCNEERGATFHFRLPALEPSSK